MRVGNAQCFSDEIDIQENVTFRKKGRWVAKLVAILLATAGLGGGFESRHLSKIQNRDISKGVAKTL
jgi:hypothetical protein